MSWKIFINGVVKSVCVLKNFKIIYECLRITDKTVDCRSRFCFWSHLDIELIYKMNVKDQKGDNLNFGESCNTYVSTMKNQYLLDETSHKSQSLETNLTKTKVVFTLKNRIFCKLHFYFAAACLNQNRFN